MKKIFYFILALVLGAGNARALEYEPASGMTYMGFFGMNVSKLQNHTEFGRAKVGATLGVKVDYVLPKAHGTYLTAGLDWTMKGGKAPLYDAIYNLEAGTLTYDLHYLEIPVRVGFRYNMSESLGIYGEVGPYFAIGVGGKHKCRVDADGTDARLIEEQATYAAFKNYDYPKEGFQRWDAGISFRVGAEYEQHYNLMIGCDWGLSDLYRGSYRDAAHDNGDPALPKVKNFNFSITVGYRF
jgi:hypothetical protein